MRTLRTTFSTDPNSTVALESTVLISHATLLLNTHIMNQMKKLLHIHTDDGEHLSIHGEFYHITRVCFSHLRQHRRCLPTEKACLPPRWQMLKHRLCRFSSSETFPRSNLTTSEITSDDTLAYPKWATSYQCVCPEPADFHWLKHILCTNSRTVHEKYFTVCSLNELFQSADCNTVIHFIKETKETHFPLCQISIGCTEPMLISLNSFFYNYPVFRCGQETAQCTNIPHKVER